MKWVISESRWFINSIDANKLETDLIEISDERYKGILDELSVGGKKISCDGTTLTVIDQDMYPKEWYAQQEINIASLHQLSATDWKVIRELERLYLLGTDLNIEREALRTSIVKQTTPNQ